MKNINDVIRMNESAILYYEHCFSLTNKPLGQRYEFFYIFFYFISPCRIIQVK